MRLRQLKLAGFKSFVDAVTIPFPSQLVAVVGPNGCGKSNVIDAVRWVMGESHAKNLRGESMADVIFKGATHRKSVGQASVELIFDNSMGGFKGPYASYQEIAVKRLITRDGDSSYYLNGTRCRRRDITDIFLGTGVGARGYSIIGQDTISRLIEARPEELRAYMEEAAGVSKYKDRRRETLQRIAQTRDNLSRVADIQAELEKQLARLERQAKAALQYLQLKQDEQQARVTIHILKWHHLQIEQQQCHAQSTQLTLQHDTHQSQVAEHYKTSVALRVEVDNLSAEHQQMQVQFYQFATDIARLEEAIQQHTRDKQQLATDQQQLDQDLQQAEHQLQTDSLILQNTKQRTTQLQADMQRLQDELAQIQQRMQVVEQDELNWNTVWQSISKELHDTERDIQLETMRFQHLEESRQRIQVSFEQNNQEQALVDPDALHVDLIECQYQQSLLDEAHQAAVDQQHACTKLGATVRQQLLDVERQLHHAHDNLQALTTERAALMAAQSIALQSTPSTIPVAANRSRVIELMSAEDAWMRIAECVLSDSLQAVVLDSVEDIFPELKTLHGQTAMFTQPMKAASSCHSYPRLSDKLTGIIPSWFVAAETIFAADTIEQAQTWLASLEPHQSVVTQDGFWLGLGWVRVFNLEPENDIGLLSRKQAIANLNIKLAAGEADITSLANQRDALHAALTANQNEQLTIQENVALAVDASRSALLIIQQKKQAHEEAVGKQIKLHDDRETLLSEIEMVNEQLFNIEAKRNAMNEQVELLTTKKQQLLLDKTLWEHCLKETKAEYNQLSTQFQNIQLQFSQDNTKTQHIEEQIKRTQSQVELLRKRDEGLKRRRDEINMPNTTLQDALTQKIHEYNQLDGLLLARRQHIDERQQCLQQTEQLCKHEEQRVKELEQQLQQLQLNEHTVATRIDTLIESLNELDSTWETLSADLDMALSIDACEQERLKIEARISRLGAINLLAVEEYQTDLQRKEHLDTQYNDLSEALGTLERAIAKMDKETELRLKETFDQVNASFQALFPRLFGGGHATLELTCDNLLEAGILVMAQPPGKRNNTIYMLSGGEKAMTAIALVFAIFQLNPSPFCMLDEVDAPLDEANVRRFCDLVKDMSQLVQFLFITHNKVTMELADHLIGVTMREPGVSRIVSVDVNADIQAMV